MLSPIEGHKAVLSALSDFRIAYEENFRFETLLSTLRLPDDFDAMNDSDSVVSFADEDGIWDARVASMTLINGLTNCPDDLEERVLLREEFTRRGLSELLVVRSSCHCSVSVLTLSSGSSLYSAARISIATNRCLHRREIRGRRGAAGTRKNIDGSWGQGPEAIWFRIRG